VQQVLPEYMTMGAGGMGDMAEMAMGAPPNSIPMRGGEGHFGAIDMGGMFTVLKVREGITGYDDPGWYRHPAGTVAGPVGKDELRADLGREAASKAKRPARAETHRGHGGG